MPISLFAIGKIVHLSRVTRRDPIQQVGEPVRNDGRGHADE